MAEAGRDTGPTAAQRIRQQTKEATRRALLEAGLAEVIELGGLEEPSVDAICSRAGYTRGAFYSHFEDREHFDAELFEWVLEDILRVLYATTLDGAVSTEDVVDRFTKSAAERQWPDIPGGDIHAAYLSVMRQVTDRPLVRERHAQLMDVVIERLAETMREDQRAGRIREDVDPRQAGAVLTLVAIAVITWDDVGVPVNVRGLGKTLVSLLRNPRTDS